MNKHRWGKFLDECEVIVFVSYLMFQSMQWGYEMAQEDAKQDVIEVEATECQAQHPEEYVIGQRLVGETPRGGGYSVHN